MQGCSKLWNHFHRVFHHNCCHLLQVSPKRLSSLSGLVQVLIVWQLSETITSDYYAPPLRINYLCNRWKTCLYIVNWWWIIVNNYLHDNWSTGSLTSVPVYCSSPQLDYGSGPNNKNLFQAMWKRRSGLVFPTFDPKTPPSPAPPFWINFIWDKHSAHSKLQHKIWTLNYSLVKCLILICYSPGKKKTN